MLNTYIVSLLKGDRVFVHVSTLVSGTAIAQAVSILFLPVLSRLYSPEQFGLFAIYLSCFNIVALISTAGYENAITIPKSNREASRLVFLVILISFLASVLLYLLIVLFGKEVSTSIGNDNLYIWLWFLPLTVTATSTFKAIQFWCNRQKDYKAMASSRVLNSVSTVTFNLLLGVSNVFGGMIIGTLIGQSTSAAWLLRKKFREILVSNESSSFTSLSQTAKKYSHFPLYIAPSQLVGVGAQQLPVFVMAIVYSPTVLGYYYLANRLILLPASLVASAIGDVYRQRISEAYRENGHFTKIYKSTLKVSVLISLPPLAFLAVLSPTIFEFFLGEAWRSAGEYAQIICVMAFLQFSFMTVDKGAVIVGATRYVFFWQVLRLTVTALVCFGAVEYSWDFENFLVNYTFALAALYSLDLFVEWRLSYGFKNGN